MAATVESLEDEIRTFLLKEGKEKMISGGLKISMREEGQIEVQELPLLSLDQMELSFDSPCGGSQRDETT
jgi:hypothetical protein